MYAAHFLPRLHFVEAKEFLRGYAFECSVVLVLIVYFALNLTPSGYAYVLRALGVSDTGLVFGEPSGLRVDEFGIWTPYLQSVVRNAFQRYNELSPYHEDFRNFNALPLRDWALLFKPQYWGFFFLPADRAFSLYHALLIGSCLIGWSLVFRLWQFPALWAAVASLLIFFSGHTQLSWTTWGPLMALLPLLILTFCSGLRPVFKFLLLTWLVTTWLFSHFYPPVIISLGIATVALVVAFTPVAAFDWRNIAVAAAASVVACLLVRFYFVGVYEIMAATVYPGQRSLDGGLMSGSQGLAHFFPFLTTRKDVSIVGLNAYEVTTGSSYLPLAALIFLDWRGFARSFSQNAKLRWAVWVILLGLAVFALWMFVPVPNDVGALVLFDTILPQRMTGATGLLLLALSLLLMRESGMRWSVTRLLLMAVLVVAMWLVWKGGPNLSPYKAFIDNGYWDLAIIPALLVAGLLLWRRKDAVATVILLACVTVNILGFGWVNPLQSAKPIFADVQSPLIESFRHLQRNDSRNWLVVPSISGIGAALNGLGLRSVGHVLIAPQLSFFRPYFPQMAPDRFNQLFNRFAWIEPTQVSEPHLISIVGLTVPIDAFFDPDKQGDGSPGVSLQSEPPATEQIGGHVDTIQTLPGNKVRLVGWALLDATESGNEIVVVSDEASQVVAESIFRPDVVMATGNPRLLRSGFKIELTGAEQLPDPDSLQVYSVGPHFGARKLILP